MTTPAPQAGTTSEFVHTLTIRDNDSLAEYPWTLIAPFALAMPDEQVEAFMQAVGAALPPNPYGWHITSSLASTTIVVTVDEQDYATVDIPAVPDAPAPPILTN